MKKIITSAIAGMLFATSSFASESPYHKVYMKDGSMTEVSSLSIKADGTADAVTADGLSVVYDAKQISRIEYDENMRSLSAKKIRRKPAAGSTVYQGNLFVQGANSDCKDGLIGMSMSHGFLFRDRFYVGLGISYIEVCKDITYVPVSLDVRYNMLKTTVLPYVEVKMGYEVTNGGLYTIEPGVGIHFGIGKHKIRRGINVGINYSMYAIPIYDQVFANAIPLHENLVLKVGFVW